MGKPVRIVRCKKVKQRLANKANNKQSSNDISSLIAHNYTLTHTRVRSRSGLSCDGRPTKGVRDGVSDISF